MRRPYSGKAYARNGNASVLNKQRISGSIPDSPSIHNLFKELDCDKEIKEGLIQMFLEDFEYYIYKFVNKKWTKEKFIYAHWHNFVPYVQANKNLLVNYRSFQKKQIHVYVKN